MPAASPTAKRDAGRDVNAPHAQFDHLKIAVREKPLGDGEASAVQVVLRTEGEKLIAYYPNSKEGLVYSYDHFFPAESTQSDIFHSISDEMVSFAVNGFSTSCIAVGPSGSGKTHTLFGSDQEAGLVQHVTRELFNHIAATEEQYEWRVRLCYFEVSCDDICDAISSASTASAAAVAAAASAKTPDDATIPSVGPTLHVVKDEKFGGYGVAGLREVLLKDWDDLDELLMKGNRRRIRLATLRRA